MSFSIKKYKILRDNYLRLKEEHVLLKSKYRTLEWQLNLCVKKNLANIPPIRKIQNKRKQKTGIFVKLSKRYNAEGIMLTPFDLWKIAKRQKAKCGLTGRSLKNNIISLDHIIPRSKNGTHDPSNLRLVILSANRAKGNLMDNEFFALCKEITDNTNRLSFKYLK